MEKVQTRVTSFCGYKSSLFVVNTCVLTILALIAVCSQFLFDLSLSTTGSWINAFGYVIFALTWLNPKMIVGWSGSGIDFHPYVKDQLLTAEESKLLPIWNQPNKLKLVISFGVLAISQLFQAIGATWGI